MRNKFGLSVFAVATILAFSTLSANAQFLATYGTDNRAKAIGEMTDEVVMERLRSDGRVAMSGTFFGNDSSELNDSVSVILFKVAKAMETLPDTRIAIVGHSDSVGDFNYNIDLSRRRAESVRNALLKDPYNVAPERLAAVGVGPIDPVASNLSVEGRALNRRVVFVVLGDPDK